jgi:CubicO group peptidase (beta-lactamase class C family)
MKRNVFDPLGMVHTQVYDDHERLVRNRAYSYRRGGDGAWIKSVLSYANRGATSLFTTAGDLALWLGNYRSGRVGGPNVIAAMRQRGLLTTGDTIPYAFAIVHGRHRGLPVLQHGGADAGYRSLLAYYPSLDAGIIVLANDAGFNSGAVGRAVADAFFDDRMTEPAPAPAAPASSPQRSDWSPGVPELEEYAGEYFSAELETLYTVVVEDGALVARHRRHGDLVLRPRERDAFTSSSWFFSGVRFERAVDGGVAGMRVSSGRVRNLWLERLP